MAAPDGMHPRDRNPAPGAAVLRFERGTIVCDGLARDLSLPDSCPLVWDPRTKRYRAEAFRYGEVRAGLTRLGPGIEVVDSVLDPISIGSWRTVPLRHYQHAALAAWELGGRLGTIVLPTGAGKTRVAIAALARPAAAAPFATAGVAGRATLVLVPTRVLLHQWRREFERFHCDRVGVLGDGHEDLRGITVATFHSARRRMPAIGNRFHCLVVDEVHHFGGSAWDEALLTCAATERLGLTATPPEGDAGLRLASLIGPVRFELRAEDLAGVFLARLEIANLVLELSPEERREYDAARADFLAGWVPFCAVVSQPARSAWQEFVRTCRQDDAGRVALKGWHRARKIAGWTFAKSVALGELLAQHRDARVLIFTHDREATYAIAREHFVMPITSDISRREREWALEAFRAGKLRALVSARVLNEGLDVPDADVAILVGGAQGTREFVQRIGRVLRPRQEKRALVYELVSAGTTEVGQSHRRRRALGSDRTGPLRHS